MDTHLICLDLDGTLLNDDKVITPLTKKVLKKLKAQGHQLIISTGRPYRASEAYYRELGMNTPIVNFNGAFVHHPRDMNFRTVHETLDLDVVHKISKRVPDLKIQNILAEIKDTVFVHYHDEVIFDMFNSGRPEIHVGELTKTLNEGPTSILIQAKDEDIPSIREDLDDLFADLIEHRRWGAPYPVIEIVKKGINKAVGVDYVRGFLGIKHEHTIAFGDEDNDNEMIEYVKHGVAMDNAIDDLKSIADYTTKSNNKDGIAHFLIDHFNLKI